MMGAMASGFPCPECGFDKLADVTSRDLVHIVELKCRRCQTKWAVENAHPPRSDGWQSPKGRVVG